MLRIHQSNRLENLFEALAERLEQRENLHPLAADVIVTERGIDRWLWQQCAQRDGIAANLDMQLPAGFVWKTLRKQFPEAPRESPYERGPLTWRVMALLDSAHDGGLLNEPAFASVAGYLRGDDDGRKRYALAQRIASLFDQYLVYRRKMILGWEKNQLLTSHPDEPWQMRLWQEIVNAAGNNNHRARLLQKFEGQARGEQLNLRELPARISVFGVPALPPAYVEVLAQLAHHVDIAIYALNPSEAFWGETLAPRGIASLFAQEYGDAAALHLANEEGFDGNVLLANGGGRIQQYFLDLLKYDVHPEGDLFDEPGGDTLLTRVQRDIHNNETAKRGAPVTIDTSLQVHGCYSLVREMEVLHDHLLDFFAKDDTLQPHDVLVLTPDIVSAAPAIEAVFGSHADAAAAAQNTSASRRIPYAIADLPRGSEHPLTGAFRQLLRLPESRFTASEVLGLLETPAVAKRAGDLSPDQVDFLRERVRSAGIRWGLDAAHRRELGFPADEANTWRFGLRRLFLGLTVPDTDALVLDIAPEADIEGADGVAIGHLQAFVDRLAHWRKWLGENHTAQEWHALVEKLVADFFDGEDGMASHAIDTITDASRAFVGELTLAGHTDAISPAVFRADIEARLAQPAAHGGLLTGAVTFAQLVPARSVPYRVICVVGMNDGLFPRQESPATFDILARHPQRGDLSRRADDRHLFLETLLSVRDIFYISYTDRTLQDSKPLQPSLVVAELIDTILAPETDSKKRDELRKQLVTQHPLQPFSPRQYDAHDPRLFSYDPDWLPAADATRQGRRQPPPFCAEPLPPPEKPATVISLTTLEFALSNAARTFLRNRLKLFLREDDTALEDDEPFALPDDFATKDAWLDAAVAGVGADEFLVRLRARGVTPAGAFAELAWRDFETRCEPMVSRLQEDTDLYEPMPVDIPLPGGRRITGHLGSVSATKQRLLSSSDKPHAKLFLQGWIRHLAACAMRGGDAIAGDANNSRADDSGNSDARFATVIETLESPVTIALGDTNPESALADLVALYDEIQCSPVRFFPKSAWAFLSKDDEDAGLRDARNKWRPDFDVSGFGGEGDDADWNTCFRHDPDPVSHPDFRDLARRVFGPLLHANPDIANTKKAKKS